MTGFSLEHFSHSCYEVVLGVSERGRLDKGPRKPEESSSENGIDKDVEGEQGDRDDHRCTYATSTVMLGDIGYTPCHANRVSIRF